MALTLEDWRALRERTDMRQLATSARTESKSVTVLRNGVAKTISVLYCPELPIELARKAGTTVESYSLARNMASEGYSGQDYTLAMMVIGTIGKNVALQKYPAAHFPITTLLTWSAYAAVRWRYGEQSGRFAATTRDPTRWHVVLADAIRAGEVPDVTRGAVKYLDPWPPGASQRGKPLPPFDEVMRSWHTTLAWREVPGLESTALAIFAPEGDPNKRKEALGTLLGLWARMPRGREPESEGHSRTHTRVSGGHGGQGSGGQSGDRLGRTPLVGAVVKEEVDTKNPDVPRMVKELKDLDQLIGDLAKQWPPGLTDYPTESTLQLCSALVGMKIAMVNGILSARQDVRQVLINDEEWNRITNQLDRAVERILPAMKALTADKKKGETVTKLPADFRDNVLKLAIEINSAVPAISTLKDNVPGLFVSILVGMFVVTGMAMTSFLRDTFTLVINGAIEIAKLAGRAANALRKALIPDWLLWVGGGLLVGGAIYKASKDDERKEVVIRVDKA